MPNFKSKKINDESQNEELESRYQMRDSTTSEEEQALSTQLNEINDNIFINRFLKDQLFLNKDSFA